MKWALRLLAIGLLAGLAMWAQAGQDDDHSAPPAQSPSKSERPTLGPKTGPETDATPPTYTAIDLHKLLRIHSLYIESIDNSLSDKLVETLGKLGRFRLVTKQKDADATLRGSCLESRHLKHVHVEVFISDRNGASVWQDTIYRPFNPPTLDQAVTDTAAVVATHLQRTIQAAERR